MVRSILRHVQNSLVIMSVALVFLAFQRLESLEVVHSAPSSLWPYPPPSSENQSEDGSPDQAAPRLGSHHELFVGREYRIGLFRFVLPILKLAKPVSESYSTQENVRSNVRLTPKRLPLSYQTQQSRLAIVVPIDSCSFDTVDAAAVFAHSLRNETDIHLYAIFLNDESTQCSSMLKGYQILSLAKIFRWTLRACPKNHCLFSLPILWMLMLLCTCHYQHWDCQLLQEIHSNIECSINICVCRRFRLKT